MATIMVRYRSLSIKVALATIGVVLIGVSATFHWELFKVSIDHLVAEIGALLFVVAVLHWIFELKLREEMIRSVAETVVGSSRLHDAGLDTCMLNSRDVSDRQHWGTSTRLRIGVQYSPKFFKDFHDVIARRCNAGRPKTVLVLEPAGAAARYLKESDTGSANVAGGVEEIVRTLAEAEKSGPHARLLKHDRVLRYSFIETDEFVWIKFFTNSAGQALVPAFKCRSGSPLFEFFSADIDRLEEASHE